MNALKSWPKISLVTPNLNQGLYLERTIESVLGQNYPNLEYVIVDGGSSDNSLQIIQKYSSQLKLIRQNSKGHYQGVQEGFDVCTGELMGWINSDDTLVPGSLSVVARIFTNFPGVDWITGVPSLTDENGNLVMTYPSHRYSQLEFLLNKMTFVQQESTFWRRSLWEASGARFDLNYNLAADYELWMRFFKFARLHTVQTHFGQFRLRLENQKSYTQKAQYEAEIVLINSKELVSLEIEGRKRLNKLKTLDKTLERFKNMAPGRILRRLEFERTKLLERPFSIIFDRDKYDFKFEEMI